MIPIVPQPQEANIKDGSFELGDDFKVYLSEADNKKLNYSYEELKSNLEGSTIFSVTKTSTEEEADLVLKISENFVVAKGLSEAKLKEAYSLKISDSRISIEGSNPKAIFHGTISLIQLIEKAEDLKLSQMEIFDYPDLAVRGISDDISRGQVSTLENFKRIIDFLARHKMNTYMPYLEDMVRFDKYPSIGKGRGALTEKEVKELVNYAERNFVEVIPIFQTLGHYENILAQEKFLKYAEFPGAASLNVASEETYEFLENMLKEVFEMFPSKKFHMGADESWDVGLGESKELVEESSLAEVHLKHYKRVYEICKKYDKEVLMYGDILLHHPEILDELPKDITVVDWHYRANFDYESAELFKEKGFDYYVSPSVWNFTSTFPANVNALPNIKYIIKSGMENDANGMINSNWGDYGAETIKELVLFGYAYSAAEAWNNEGTNVNEFSNNFFHDFFGVDNPELSRIYEVMSNPFNQMLWHEVWRHPLLEIREPVWWESQMSKAGKISWMNWTLPNVEKTIEEMRPKLERNKGHLDIIDFLIDLNYWYQTKLEAQNELHKKMNGKEFNEKRALSLIDQNISTLKDLKSRYKDIWLRYYKEANLDMIEDKFERLISYFEETKNELQKEDTLTSPLIESDWIYCKTGDKFADKAVFKRTIDIGEDVKQAHLQLLGDTYAKLYINGEFVEQVFARRSLSLLVDYERIKFLDATKYFKKGENTIRVEVENFNRNGEAGFNLISQIETSEKTIKLLSNSSWLAKPMASDVEKWKYAVPQDYRYPVIAPNFETKRMSWIER
jgi:hypothetical protein